MDECQYGCGHRDNVVDLAGHEEACPFSAKCIIKACHWLGQVSKLVKHVEDAHPGRLVDSSAVEHNFSLGFEHPVLLLTHWHKTSPTNVFYWLRLHKNRNSKYIMIQFAAQIGREVDMTFLVKEYSVSPINFPKLSVKIEVVFTKSNEHDILKDKFVESQGTDVTVFNSDEFQINIKDVSPQISESLALNLECFICAEIMSGRIRMCVTGHSFCDTCCGKINNKCPNCQKEINPSARNYTLEALTENLLANIGNTSKGNEVIPCRYKDSGCQFTDNEGGIDGHVEVCQYQPWKCKYSSENSSSKCQWKGPHKYLAGHIVSEHGAAVRPVNASHLVSYRRGCYYYYHDNNYFVCSLRVTTNKEYVVYLAHLTTEAKSKYYFKLRALTGSGRMLRILKGSFTGQRCRHVFKSRYGIKDDHDQLTIMVDISTKPA